MLIIQMLHLAIYYTDLINYKSLLIIIIKDDEYDSFLEKRSIKYGLIDGKFVILMFFSNQYK